MRVFSEPKIRHRQSGARLLPIQPKYQATISGSLFGSDLVDTLNAAFNKYNSHNHSIILPADPRKLDVRNGEQIYITDINGNSVFPDNTLVSQVSNTAIQADSPANMTVSKQTLYLLNPGQNPANDPSLLENAQSISGVSTTDGSADISVDADTANTVEAEMLDRWCRVLIKGSMSVYFAGDIEIFPPNLSPPMRLLGYQFEAVSRGSALSGAIELNLKKRNEGGTTEELEIGSLPVSLDSANNYSVSDVDLSPAGDVIKANEGLTLQTSGNRLSTGTAPSYLDMDAYDSLTELVDDGLDSASAQIYYWLEMTHTVIENA